MEALVILLVVSTMVAALSALLFVIFVRAAVREPMFTFLTTVLVIAASVLFITRAPNFTALIIGLPLIVTVIPSLAILARRLTRKSV